MIEPQKEYQGLSCTINTNMDCNLACKYCYEFCKKNEVIKEEYWKKFIDLILSDPDILKTGKSCREQFGLQEEPNALNEKNIILDLIGGDSLMHPQMVEDIFNYFKYKIVTTNNKYKNRFRFSISSNGVTLLNPKARQVVEDNIMSLSLGISLDGCKYLHDLNRIKSVLGPNGEELGTFDDIMKIWPWYSRVSAQSNSTKATWASQSIPYLYKSLLAFYNLNIIYITQNSIMENDPRDDTVLDTLCDQFLKMIDFCRYKNNEICSDTFSYTFFANTRSFDEGNKSDGLTRVRCGASSMPCVGTDGKIYGCFRALPHAYRDTSPLIIGHVNTGIKADNKDDYIFKSHEECYTNNMTKEQKCRECEIESACAYCPMGCWQEFGEFKRTTYICNTTRIESAFSKAYWEWFCKELPERAKKQDKQITWDEDQKYRLLEYAFEDKQLSKKWSKKLKEWIKGNIEFNHEKALKEQAKEDDYYWWNKKDCIK